MSLLFIALPIALMLGAAKVIACVRLINSGQFDDLQSPQVRIHTYVIAGPRTPLPFAP